MHQNRCNKYSLCTVKNTYGKKTGSRKAAQAEADRKAKKYHKYN